MNFPDPKTHKILSKETLKHKIELQKKYKKHGLKVRIDLIVTYLLLSVLLSGCICGRNTPENTTEKIKIIEVIDKIPVKQIITENKTVYRFNDINKTIYNTVEIKINLTRAQEHELLNMRPDICHAAACSEGFKQAKWKALEILGLKTPKFSEAYGNTLNDKPYETNDTWVCMDLKYDNFTKYLEFPRSYWYISGPTDQTIKLRKTGGFLIENYT